MKIKKNTYWRVKPSHFYKVRCKYIQIFTVMKFVVWEVYFVSSEYECTDYMYEDEFLATYEEIKNKLEVLVLFGAASYED